MREAMTMITLQKLTPTQSTIIRSAAQHPEGRIAMPAALQGGARAMTFNGLLIRGWIIETGDGQLLTDAGYATIGQQRPPPPIDDSPARDSVQPCRLDDTQRVSGSCIHAGMSRWPCSTRQPSMCSARSM